MKLPFKTLWSEFKSFAFKGNMIDLAVAVVIGTAFGLVINSLVADIIMPSISYVTSAVTKVKDEATDLTEAAGTKMGLGNQPAPTQPAAATLPATAPPAAPATPAAAPPASPAAPGAPPQAVDFSWKIGRIQIGHFIASLINFMLIAFSVFILMVKMLGSVAKRAIGQSEPSEPTTKECPECLSIIPYKARRCAHCTSVLVSTETK